jgi:hypothetical protein
MAEEVTQILFNTSAATAGLPGFIAEPLSFLATLTKFLIAGIGLYVLYLIIMLIMNWRRGKRIKRIEQKVDLIMSKLNINEKQEKKKIKKKRKNKK